MNSSAGREAGICFLTLSAVSAPVSGVEKKSLSRRQGFQPLSGKGDFVYDLNFSTNAI